MLKAFLLVALGVRLSYGIINESILVELDFECLVRCSAQFFQLHRIVILILFVASVLKWLDTDNRF
jgi:hypothetical protein